jgi:hypothetical protein
MSRIGFFLFLTACRKTLKTYGEKRSDREEGRMGG